MKTIYSGIDVSKDKLDVALTQDGIVIAANATFQNSCAGFKKLFDWAKKRYGMYSIHFCIEATGIYHEDITEYFKNRKILLLA